MVNAACTLVMTPRATDGHSIRIVKGVNLCTSFIFTPKIAKIRAENENGILVRTSSGRKEQHAIDEPGQLSNTENK